MENQLSKYPTSLAEDLAVLASNVYAFGSDRRNAIVIIKGEKEVCQHYIDLAKLCIPLLEMEVRRVLLACNKVSL